ncbi:MAG: hypothetical protein EXS18_05575 [Verrucomicrobiae bacterium]|nr:hypothetical protein [Verrucomicrobiae bacterium]
MKSRSPFSRFDFTRIRRYSLATRENRTRAGDLVWPETARKTKPAFQSRDLDTVARAILAAKRARKPVIWMTGAHPLKCGFSPLIVDLMKRGFVSLFATNGAGTIHDFELALIGETSEHVPDGLRMGTFGFARETGRLMNLALRHGNRKKIGHGESLGRFLCGEPFPKQVNFPHGDWSILATGWRLRIPVTAHVTVGGDIIHQHPEFDGEAVGGCSGRDFAIFAAHCERLVRGGVVINIGSAVTNPEVLLKSVSMCSNIGKPPRGIVTANFDFQPVNLAHMRDERKPGYYHRDLKSIVTRIPQAFGGRGYYICGDFLKTVPALYHTLVS